MRGMATTTTTLATLVCAACATSGTAGVSGVAVETPAAAKAPAGDDGRRGDGTAQRATADEQGGANAGRGTPPGAAGAPPSIAADPNQVLAGFVPRLVQAPPFVESVKERVAMGATLPPPRLRQVSRIRNSITDEEAWFARNGLSRFWFAAPDAPAYAPTLYRDAELSLGIEHADHTVLVFGANLLAVLDRQHVLTAFFDFAAYSRGPRDVPRDEAFIEQAIEWAEVRDGVLYVAHGHRTYAKSSGGLNAYVTALEFATGRLLWRSAALVANARNFLLHEGLVVTGYGFTAEPDFLYLLDRATGKVVSRTPLVSAPDYIFLRDGALRVRTYDTDYVFEFVTQSRSAGTSRSPVLTIPAPGGRQ